MKCPTDGSTLVMSERSGVEIDYCPTCRGVWLDRGELDKILDRAAAESTGYGSAPTPASTPPGYEQSPGFGGFDTRGYGDRRDERYRDDRDRDGYGRGDHGRGRRKRESWLSDLFD